VAKQFTSPTAFKASLEARLRTRATELGVPFQTLQLKIVMERLVARLFHAPAPWLLKGGFAMDLRFRPRARTTKDIDLSVTLVPGGGNAELRDQLQTAAGTDLGDFLTFRIGELKAELTNAPKGGGRFPCEAVLAGKVYAKFHLDVGLGDAVVGEPEQLTGDDLLAFAGIGPAVAFAIPKAQQFAEKLHAYTFPWAGQVNTRTKDLVDLVLLIERGVPDVGRGRGAARTPSLCNSHRRPRSGRPTSAGWRRRRACPPPTTWSRSASSTASGPITRWAQPVHEQ
jgi:Nucleotidyl transferase AbiEii toxin, Type IV TA system